MSSQGRSSPGSITFEELGKPDSPQDVIIPDVGRVKVTQRDINVAKQLGGNPIFNLIPATHFGSDIRDFILGVPEQEE